MAEGTRLKSLEEQWRRHDAKLTELNELVQSQLVDNQAKNKELQALQAQWMSTNKKIDNLEAKFDTKFDNLVVKIESMFRGMNKERISGDEGVYTASKLLILPTPDSSLKKWGETAIEVTVEEALEAEKYEQDCVEGNHQEVECQVFDQISHWKAEKLSGSENPDSRVDGYETEVNGLKKWNEEGNNFLEYYETIDVEQHVNLNDEGNKEQEVMMGKKKPQVDCQNGDCDGLNTVNCIKGEEKNCKENDLFQFQTIVVPQMNLKTISFEKFFGTPFLFVGNGIIDFGKNGSTGEWIETTIEKVRTTSKSWTESFTAFKGGTWSVYLSDFLDKQVNPCGFTQENSGALPQDVANQHLKPPFRAGAANRNAYEVKVRAEKIDHILYAGDEFPEKVVVQMNDTHPTICIPELMRILMDLKGLNWKEAWNITQRTVAYTKHTLLLEALEKWSYELLQKLLPRHVQTLEIIDEQLVDEIVSKYGTSTTKILVKKLNAIRILENFDWPTSVAYRYKRWKWDDDIYLVARCEVQSVVEVNNQRSFSTLNALYSGMDGRQKLEPQRGAVLATELKNNANKLAKWTAQSLLASADMMKLGYVSRMHSRDHFNHVIMAVVGYKAESDVEFKAVSWRNALAVMAEVIHQVKANEIVGIAGKLSDAESMMALKEFFNKIGSNNVFCEGNGLNPNADLRSRYIMNTSISGLENADVFLLVGIIVGAGMFERDDKDASFSVVETIAERAKVVPPKGSRDCFLKGRVDSDTLPLNVSRDMLQQHSSLKTIKKKLIRKALDMICKFAEEDPNEANDSEKTDMEESNNSDEKKGQYTKLWNEFGKSIKLGIIEDVTNRNCLVILPRFEITKAEGKLTSLVKYISRMKPGQKGRTSKCAATNFSISALRTRLF